MQTTPMPMLSRRAAILAALMTPMAGYIRPAKASPALLSINLDQWESIVVTWRDRSVVVSAADVFAILQEER